MAIIPTVEITTLAPKLTSAEKHIVFVLLRL
jgi:hypothetical protein